MLSELLMVKSGSASPPSSRATSTATSLSSTVLCVSPRYSFSSPPSMHPSAPPLRMPSAHSRPKSMVISSGSTTSTSASSRPTSPLPPSSIFMYICLPATVNAGSLLSFSSGSSWKVMAEEALQSEVLPFVSVFEATSVAFTAM